MYSKKTDEKRQKIWEEKDIFKFNENAEGEIYYIMEMFSYPSGAKLHVGHWFNYAPVDTFARYKKMKGYNIFHPMGFDSFGLPAENYAIKTGIHPLDSTEKNIESMKKQLKEMGASFDWSHTFCTHTKEYYKWTQWLFLKLYENGLAYQKEANVNWCDSCNTVLANEQVIDGKCERCGNQVKRKKLKQWFFKITKYAEQLINDLDGLDWPETTKKIQKNWIGKSIGTEVYFDLENPITLENNEKIDKITVFTTRPDTLYGVTFISVAPESEIGKALVTRDQKEEAEEYIEKTAKLSDIERQFTEREKTGVFTGSYVIHPLTQKKIPVYIADYVLEDYATGFVMGVPAHDDRDFNFAEKYGTEFIQVISKTGEEDAEKSCYTEKEGVLINSFEFSGLSPENAKEKITEKLEQLNKGRHKVNYKLKDWLVSRQRYWGSPIPIIYCDKCGTVPVPEKDLPVELPYNVEFKPDGKSPLAKCSEFIHTTCPICGGEAKREADTLDTFVCSSWYELRYPEANNPEKPFTKEVLNKFLPVKKYVGGAEHAAMHLIYTRFIKKVLRDLGYIDFGETFSSLVHQGLLLGPDGNKMSKSKGNTISPDDMVNAYGSDTLRMYLMFGFTYSEGGPWSEDGIKAIYKYINRISLIHEEILKGEKIKEPLEKEIKLMEYEVNRVIKEIERDIELFSFNTCIARLMELTNTMQKHLNEYGVTDILKNVYRKFLLILSPFAPHYSCEAWEEMGEKNLIYFEKWPKLEKEKLVLDNFNLPIQINGKVRDVLNLSKGIQEEEIKEIVYKSEKIINALKDKVIVKEIYVKEKIYNIVVK